MEAAQPLPKLGKPFSHFLLLLIVAKHIPTLDQEREFDG